MRESPQAVQRLTVVRRVLERLERREGDAAHQAQQDVRTRELRCRRPDREGTSIPLTKSQSEYLEGLTQLAASEAQEPTGVIAGSTIAAKARVARSEDHARDGESATA